MKPGFPDLLPPSEPSEAGASQAAYTQHRNVAGVGTVLVVAAVFVANAGAPSPSWRFATALALAGFGCAMGLVSFARYVARWDEMQRGIMLIAASTALLGTVMALTINGALAKHAYPHISATFAVFVPIALFLVIYPIVRSAYR